MHVEQLKGDKPWADGSCFQEIRTLWYGPGNLRIVVFRNHGRECLRMKSVYLGAQKNGDAVLQGGITDRAAGYSGRSHE